MRGNNDIKVMPSIFNDSSALCVSMINVANIILKNGGYWSVVWFQSGYVLPSSALAFFSHIAGSLIGGNGSGPNIDRYMMKFMSGGSINKMI